MPEHEQHVPHGRATPQLVPKLSDETAPQWPPPRHVHATGVNGGSTAPRASAAGSAQHQTRPPTPARLVRIRLDCPNSTRPLVTHRPRDPRSDSDVRPDRCRADNETSQPVPAPDARMTLLRISVPVRWRAGVVGFFANHPWRSAATCA